jgi:hypothetical protein
VFFTPFIFGVFFLAVDVQMEPKTKSKWTSVVTFDYPSGLPGAGAGMMRSTGHQRAPPRHQHRTQGDATSRQLLMLPLPLTPTTTTTALVPRHHDDRTNTHLLLRSYHSLRRINSASGAPLRDAETLKLKPPRHDPDHVVTSKVPATATATRASTPILRVTPTPTPTSTTAAPAKMDDEKAKAEKLAAAKKRVC